MVNFIDDQIGLVTAALKAKGLWDDMLFVMSSGQYHCDATAGLVLPITLPFPPDAPRQWRPALTNPEPSGPRGHVWSV